MANNPKSFSVCAEAGQAMLEYALLSTVVVTLGIASYMTGWVEGIQDSLADVLMLVSLPMP